MVPLTSDAFVIQELPREHGTPPTRQALPRRTNVLADAGEPQLFHLVLSDASDPAIPSGTTLRG